MEPQRLQLIQKRGNGRYEARLFGIKQYTKASTKANGKRGGHLPCQSVIEDHNRIGGLQSQREHFRFPRSKIHDQREDGSAGRRAYRDPLEHGRIRQAHPLGPTDREFVHDRGRHNDTPSQGLDNMQHAKLIEILERRGVADDLRQGGSPAPSRVSSGETWLRHSPPVCSKTPHAEYPPTWPPPL